MLGLETQREPPALRHGPSLGLWVKRQPRASLSFTRNLGFTTFIPRRLHHGPQDVHGWSLRIVLPYNGTSDFADVITLGILRWEMMLNYPREAI